MPVETRSLSGVNVVVCFLLSLLPTAHRHGHPDLEQVDLSGKLGVQAFESGRHAGKQAGRAFGLQTGVMQVWMVDWNCEESVRPHSHDTSSKMLGWTLEAGTKNL